MQSMIEHRIRSSFRRKPESRALENAIPFPTYRSKNKGFTLIELIIFIVVGAIILPMSFVAFTSAMKYFSTPDYYVKARFFAEQKMEELTSNTYTAIPPSGSDVPATNYPRSWTVSYIDSSLNSSMSDLGYKKIVLSITMPDSAVYDVSTIVTRRPKL